MADSYSAARRLRLSTSSDFTTWTPLPEAIVRGCTWGSALRAGSATADWPWGPAVARDGAVGPSAAPLLANLVNLWARIEEETAPSAWTPRWWGIITGGAVDVHLGASGVTALQLEDLHGVLNRRLLLDCFVESAAGALYNLQRWPTIAHNRAAGTTTINGRTAYAFRLGPIQGAAAAWTAVDLLTSAIAHCWPTAWPTLTFNNLAQVPVLGLEVWGWSLADLLGALYGPAYGRTYALTVSGSTITIAGKELGASAGYTLNASTDAALLTLTGRESWATVCDEVRVCADRPPLHAVTLAYLSAGGGQLQAVSGAPGLFEISSTWDGLGDLGSDGLQPALTTTTGARATGGDRPARGVELEALPYPVDRDATAASPFAATLDLRQARQQPRVWVQWGASDVEEVTDRIRVAFEGPNRIRLGQGADDALQLELWQTSATAILVSIGCRDWAPTTVIAAAASPGSQRQALIRVPVDEARITAGFAYRSTSGALARTGAATAIAAAATQLKTLADTTVGQQLPQVDLTWTKAGLVLTPDPGVTIAMVGTNLNGSARPMVMQRTWRQQGAAWVTTWQAESRPADLRGIA